MKYNKIKHLAHFYLPRVQIESIAVGLLFFTLPTILIVTWYINLIVLYMPYFLLTYMGLYIVIYGFLRLGLRFMMKSFQSFGNKKELDYNAIKNQLAMIFGTILLVIFIVIYWILFY